jgi:hypothetical protein
MSYSHSNANMAAFNAAGKLSTKRRMSCLRSNAQNGGCGCLQCSRGERPLQVSNQSEHMEDAKDQEGGEVL